MPTIGDLVAVAHAAGRTTATTRTIRGWRDRELVSAPARYGATYRYPLTALGEVDSYARWGRRKMPPELLPFARYIEAGTVEVRQAVAACRRTLHLFGEEDGAELAAQGPEAVRQEAQRAARARGRNAILPRRIRMSLDDRVVALSYLFSLALPGGLHLDERDRGQFQLERALGLRAGRGGSTRDVSHIMGPAEEWRVDLGALDAAVRDATPGGAEMARRFVEITCLWLPALLPLFASQLAPEERPFLDIAQAAAAEMVPEVYVLLFAWWLARSSLARTGEDAAAALEEFQPAAMMAEDLSARSEAEISTVRAVLRPYQRVQLRVARLAAERTGS